MINVSVSNISFFVRWMWFSLGDNKIISHGVAKETRGKVDEGIRNIIINQDIWY